MTQILIILIAFSVFLSACKTNPPPSTSSASKTVQQECGISRGSFIGSWFDFYERALSYADCSMWEKSEQDLRRALKKRSVDKRRVYSLGMHFINDYFPNRELGIALFNLKKYSQAKSYLELSLSQFPTSKAEEYLKRVRMQELADNNSDKLPPQITLTSPEQNSIHTASIIQVSGSVSDDSYIDSLTINDIPYRYIPQFKAASGEPVRIARKVADMDFTLDVPVNYKDGQAKLTIIAKDITGKQSQIIQTIYQDKEGPQLSLNQISKQSDNEYHLVLNANDKHSEVEFITINDKQYQLSTQTDSDQEGSLQHQIHIDEVLSGPFDNNHILVIATDKAGNKTQANISVPQQNEQAVEESSEEKNPPEFYLVKGDEVRNTHEKVAYIEGEVESDSDITKLEINGNNILSAKNQHLFFNYSAELKMGENRFELVAQNKDGLSEKKSIIIHRQQAPGHSIKERLKLAHFPFPCNQVSRAPCHISSELYPQLYEKLIERQRFQVMEQKLVNQLLDTTRQCEKKVTENCMTKVADQLTAKGKWKKTFANAIFAGTVIERKNNLGNVSVEISGRIVDNSNREIITSIDVYAENLDQDKFKQLSQNFAVELADAFPLVDAKINKMTNNDLVLEMTENERVWTMMPLLIYQVSDNKSCGNARIEEISETVTQAKIEHQLCKSINTDNYRVITR